MSIPFTMALPMFVDWPAIPTSASSSIVLTVLRSAVKGAWVGDDPFGLCNHDVKVEVGGRVVDTLLCGGSVMFRNDFVFFRHGVFFLSDGVAAGSQTTVTTPPIHAVTCHIIEQVSADASPGEHPAESKR